MQQDKALGANPPQRFKRRIDRVSRLFAGGEAVDGRLALLVI